MEGFFEYQLGVRKGRGIEDKARLERLEYEVKVRGR